MAHIDNATDTKEQVFNWFLPSSKAMEALLRNVGLGDVSIFSAHSDRAVLVCRKRKVIPDSHLLSHLAGRVTIEDAPAKCGVDAEIESVSLPTPSPNASPLELFAVLLDGVVLAMSRLSNADTVRLAFEWILGQSPDLEATAHYSRVLEAKPDGARKLVREFLLRWDVDSVAPAPIARTCRLS